MAMEMQALTRARQMRLDLQHAEDEGYFGPSSAIWRIQREAVLGLGLLRSLLMQLAHPWVAQAVVDHSTFPTQPSERFLAVIEASLLLVFGSRSQADQAAHRIRSVHTRIHGVLREDVGRWRRGTPYWADDPEALLWVWITLVDSTLLLYDYCFGPMDRNGERMYLREAGHVGIMLGIPPELLLQDRRELDAQTNRWLADGTLAVGTAARQVARHLVRLPVFGLPLPLLWLYRSLEMAAARRFLPHALRWQYGDILASHRTGTAALSAVPLVVRRVPTRLRTDPIAAAAVSRWGPVAA